MAPNAGLGKVTPSPSVDCSLTGPRPDGDANRIHAPIRRDVHLV